MSTTTVDLRLRVPADLKAEVERLAAEDLRSVNSEAITLLRAAIAERHRTDRMYHSAAAIAPTKKGPRPMITVRQLAHELGMQPDDLVAFADLGQEYAYDHTRELDAETEQAIRDAAAIQDDITHE